MIDLPAEQRELVDRVTAFVDSEVVPVAQARDTRDEYPVDLVGRLRELGLFGLVASVQYGGAGVELPAYALVMEELGRGWVSLVPIVNAHSSVVTILSRYGTEAQRGHWLPRLARGELMGALGLTEASGGSDLAAITTTANRQGDGYHVRGAKRLITHARGAGLLLVLAKTDPAAEPSTRALALFLLEQEGVEWRVTRDLPKLGARSVETSELTIEASVPADRLVGEQVGAGFRQLMDGLEVGRIAVAAAAIGLARAALWDAVAYARERRAFGRPIAELQGLRFKLADLATQIAAARALVLAAARAKSRGGRHDLETSMAKLAASEVAARAALDGIRVLGGNGFLKDFPVERYYRDAPMFVVGEGTNEVLQELIGRRLLAGRPSLEWL